jgi:hypothetical protein
MQAEFGGARTGACANARVLAVPVLQVRSDRAKRPGNAPNRK